MVVVDKKQTGLLIYNVRTSANLTREAVARICGFTTANMIYDYESGKKLPSLNSLYHMAKAFRVSMEELLVWKEEDMDCPS